jgi:hypothetical protein
MQLQRKADRTPTPVESRTVRSPAPFARAAPVDTSGHAHDMFAPERNGSRIAESLLRVRELPRIATVAQLRLQLKPDGLGGDRNGPLSAPVRFRSSSTGSSRDPSVIFPRTRPASESSKDLQQPRKIDPQGPLPSTNADSQSHGPVAAEIRVAPLVPDSESLVWRKTETVGASGLAASSTGARGSEFVREAISESVFYRDESPESASKSNLVDVPKIAEQVTRAIARQLRIECERRGISR